MTKSLVFFGRQELIENFRVLYTERKHVLIVGADGIGKTALLRQVNQRCPMLVCEESSSLRRICDSLEGQLGWVHDKVNVMERKNQLLGYLGRRGEPVAFDLVASTTPRVARFFGRLGDQIPVLDRVSFRSSQGNRQSVGATLQIHTNPDTASNAS